LPLQLLEGLELRPFGGAGNLLASTLGQPGYWQFDTPTRLYGAGTETAFSATAFTERHYGTAVRKRLRKRLRMNGNIRLETRH